MASAPSRYDVEHLHRLMMQASLDASQLDKRLTDEQKGDSLSAELRHWHDAADAIQGAVERARTELLRDGTPKEQVDRVRDRLKELKDRSKRFDIDNDLEGCVQHWKALGLEFAQLSGKHRDTLVRLLDSRKSRVDQTTSVLSSARQTNGMLPEKHAKVRGLQDQRDNARARYERLRQQYLEAERNHQHAEQQKAQAAQVKEHQQKKAPLPDFAAASRAARKGPVLVRLPVPQAADKTAQHKLPQTQAKPSALGPTVPRPGLHSLPPPARPALPKPSTTSARPPAERKKIEAKKADEKKASGHDKKDARPGQKSHEKNAQEKARNAPGKSVVLKPGMIGYGKPQLPAKPGQKIMPGLPGQAHLHTPSNRPPTLIRPSFRPPSLTHAQQPAHHSAVQKASGPVRISLERIERVAGYPTGVDGIGRGGQSASLFFRAENLPESLSIRGTTSIQLGCATRLDVMPSVQLFSAVAGAPLKGKLSLLLLSSGGQLGTISPRSALDAAKGAARSGGRQVAGKLGVVGKQLESAIADLLEDAADKIFRRAQSRAPQNKLPPRAAGGFVKGPTVEHHVARVNHALGGLLQTAHAVKGAPAHTQRLLQHLDRDHHHRDSVAGRLEQTLSHLATATHRTLTDSIGGELRGHLARMDAILSRLRGKAGQELASGAQEITGILQRMGGIAAGKGGAPHLSEFRRLIDERRGQLHKLSADARRKSGAEAIKHRGALHQMPLPQILGEKQLATLRRQHPGIDKLLKNASHAQLASELGKLEKTALGALLGKHKPQRNHGLGGGSITGAFQALGGAHLGGFGGGHRPGALGSLSGIGGGLGKVLEKQLEHQVKRTQPHEVGKLLATLHKAPKGTPLHELAKKAEEKQKRMATKHAGKRGPQASQITAAALLEVFKEHPKGRTFASHLAPGGSLRTLCETAQRGHGLPVGQMAQHFLAARGHSNVFNAVATFNNLIKGGHKPHRWGLGSIGHFVSSHVSSALSSVSQTVGSATNAVSNFARATASTVGSGISSFAHSAARLGGDAMDGMRNVVRRGVGAASNVALRVGRTARDIAHNVNDRASNLAQRAYKFGSGAFHSASSAISSRAHGLWNAARDSGRNAWGGMKKFGHSAWGHIKNSGQALSNVARNGITALQNGASWVQHRAGATFDRARLMAGGVVDWARQKASGAHWLGEKVHNGLEWAKKSGVVGGIGKGLMKGISFMKKPAEYTPLGLAVKAGKWAAGGGLAKVWNKTRNLAGKAWGGLKGAYQTTANFLQSPAGQLLVTGLSLAASFIPGGLVVKAIIGGGIGAIQAISEGKDWKGVFAGAAGGALTGALPFLKMGPLAKMGMGALTGGITTLAQGGNLKDALKGAAGGALDSFDPGAFKALSKLKGLSSAEKLLKGKNLSAAEKEFMAASKFAGPLRGLEKAMANPKTARMVGGLEKAGGKAVKGGIWVNGKAAKVQGVLDKVVGAGDQVHGVLSQVHDLAPGLANILGDNAAGHFVGNVGDWAGKGDDKLSKALEYGHTASDQMAKYRGYLDKGLGFAGVKNPAKAYEKRMARKDLAAGKKGGLEHVARLKLEDHKRKHPELHLAEATGKRTRGAHAETHAARRRAGGTSADDSPSSKKGKRKTSPHDAHAHGEPEGHEHGLTKKPRGGNKPKTKLEQALAKGRGLIKKGQRVAQGVHDGLGKVQGVVEKGLAGAQKVQSGLEQASALAKAGAGILGDDSELGKYLLDVSAKADQVHGYLEQGIGLADEFNKGVGKAHDLSGKIPGVHDEGDGSPLHQATHLEGGKTKHKAGEGGHDGTPVHGKKPSPHDHPKPTLKPGPARLPASNETEVEKSKRLQHAWNLISTISRNVQRYQTAYQKAHEEIQQHLAKGEGAKASLKLIDLGTECDEINRWIAEARAAAKGNDGYLKEIRFYEEWHATTKKKLHAAIADTKGLGSGTALEGFGVSEKSHPDVFENTKHIFAIRTKVQAFGEALHDHDAAGQVKKILAEAKQAKADLQRLKTKYKKDKAATRVLSGGGEQDRLIDESIQKLEAALKGEVKKPAHDKPAPQKSGHGKKKPADTMKSVEGGLKAIDKYRKKAARSGKKVDASLGKLEHALGQGIRIGKKVDGGLAKIAGVADHLAKALGDDSELGHFAHQVSGAAGAGHEKLHDALHLAGKGKQGLHKGREYFEKGLKLAAGHHEQKLEKVHGKKHANAENEHGGTHGAELVRHATAHDPHKKSPHGKLPPGLEHVIVEGQHFIHDGQHLIKDGKKSVHDVQHGVKDLKHGAKDVGSLWGHIEAHDWKGAIGDGKHLIKDGKHLFHDGKQIYADGKKMYGEGKHLVEEGKHLWGEGKHLWGEAKGLFGGGKKSPHDGPTPGPHEKHHHHHHRKHPLDPLPQPQHGGGGGFSEADIAQVVHGAMQWVTSFGKAVTAAIQDIEKLMSAGKTKEAGDRVQAVSMTSEQTRSEVTRAVSTSAKYPALHKQAQSASKHYLEIRKHLFTFVKGLHGLGGQTTGLEGVDGKKYPDLLALSTDLSSLQVKVDALGELKHSDTPMRGPVGDLKKEASGLRARVGKAKSAHKGDAAALEVVAGLSGRLQQIERHLGAHADKKNTAQGDKDLGLPGGAPRPHKKPARKPHHHRRHRRDPIDDILNGEDGRINVDRGGARGDMDVHDGQDVDPAAADTWIGSGEGVKLFSEVFGAFLPAEGTVVHHHAGGGGSHHTPSHGGGALHGQLGAGGLDLSGKFGAGGALNVGGLHTAGGIHGQGGLHLGMDGIHLEGGLQLGGDIAGHHFGMKLGGKVDVSMKSIKSRLGALIPKRATGFFKGLFDHLHGFADKISGWAKLGGKMLGMGMHFAEMGMHGLSAIEKAAAKVQGLAGKAEGSLGKMGLGKLAGFAGKIGGAAGWVDKESKLLHGGLKTADKWMGQGKKMAGQVDGVAQKAGGIFDKAEHGRFGALLNLFKASKNGDGTDGRLVPEKMRLGSQFDEPRRLDVMTISRMEGFLGGDFAGVRIHTGPGAAQVTNRFAAEAVTVKDHIFFAPGRFNPGTTEGQRLLAHELTHVMQKGRPNLDVRTAESEALHSEHTFGYGNPQMETLNLSQPAPDFRLGDGEGLGNASGVHTAKRNRSRGHEAGGKDTLPDGDEFIEQISSRVYELLMEELEHSFESR